MWVCRKGQRVAEKKISHSICGCGYGYADHSIWILEFVSGPDGLASVRNVWAYGGPTLNKIWAGLKLVDLNQTLKPQT